MDKLDKVNKLLKGQNVTIMPFGSLYESASALVVEANDRFRVCTVEMADGRRLTPISYDNVAKICPS